MCCELEEMAIHLARKARRAGGRESPLVVSLARLIDRHEGGLPALCARLEGAGLGRQLVSWIGTGANTALPACAVREALGETLFARLVRRLDLDPVDAAEVLAEILPLAIDRMTPQGRVPPAAHKPPMRAFLARLAGTLRA